MVRINKNPTLVFHDAPGKTTHVGAAQTIQTLTDPVGRLAIEIADPKLLQISEDGELVLGLNAGDPSRPELTHTQGDRDAKVNYWRIESLGLQLWAKPTETSTEE